MATEPLPGNEYLPDHVPPPGDSLAEILGSKGMDQAELAVRTGRTRKLINEIVKGKAAITPETALQLERVLGVPASFWNNRERRYQEFLARQAEEERLRQHVAWLREIPLAAMVKAGWIEASSNRVAQLRQVLQFFRIASPEEWPAIREASFRRSAAFRGNPGAVSAWLRRGENIAEEIACEPFDRKRFRDTVLRVRKLTPDPTNETLSEVVGLCAGAGVAVVVVPELPKTCASGATRWLTSKKALVQLSLRYRTDDQFWFTFFHEAAHILLGHPKKEILVTEDGASNDDLEQQANRYASELLIPGDRLQRFLATHTHISREAVLEFARDLGIAPGIVVGRLQHEQRIPYRHLNGLKVALRTDRIGTQPLREFL